MGSQRQMVCGSRRLPNLTSPISTPPFPHAKFCVATSFSPFSGCFFPSTRDLVTVDSRHLQCWRRSATSFSPILGQVPTPGQSLWSHGCVTKMLAVPIQTTWLGWGKGLFSRRRRGYCSRKIYKRVSLAIICDLHIGFLQLDCSLESKSFSS